MLTVIYGAILIAGLVMAGLAALTRYVLCRNGRPNAMFVATQYLVSVMLVLWGGFNITAMAAKADQEGNRVFYGVIDEITMESIVLHDDRDFVFALPADLAKQLSGREVMFEGYYAYVAYDSAKFVAQRVDILVCGHYRDFSADHLEMSGLSSFFRISSPLWLIWPTVLFVVLAVGGIVWPLSEEEDSAGETLYFVSALLSMVLGLACFVFSSTDVLSRIVVANGGEATLRACEYVVREIDTEANVLVVGEYANDEHKQRDRMSYYESNIGDVEAVVRTGDGVIEDVGLVSSRIYIVFQ